MGVLERRRILEAIDSSSNGDTFLEKSGTSLAFTQTIEDYIPELYIYGKSIQSGTPTPEQPIPIISTSDFKVLSYGTNVWENPNTETKNGVTLTKNNDGSIVLNGTCTETADFVLAQRYIAGGTYTLMSGNTVKSPDTSNNPMLQAYSPSSNNVIVIFSSDGADPIRTAVLPTASDYQFKVRIQAGVFYNNFMLRPLLWKGDYYQLPPPSFQQYRGTTATITSSLGSIEVSSTSKFIVYTDSLKFYCADYIYTEYGKVYKMQRIGEYTFTGVENPFLSTNSRMCFSSIDNLTPDYTNALCNQYLCITPAQIIPHGTFYIGSGNSQLVFYNENYTTTADFKTYLASQYNAGTPVKVQYILATPIVTDITSTAEGQALIRMRSQSNVTNIYTTNGNIYLKAKVKGGI